MDEINLHERISLFRSSITSDLYSASDIVYFEAVEKAVASYDREISALDSLRSSAKIETDGLSEVLLAHPRLYGLLCALLSITSSVTLEDGRVLPAPQLPPRQFEQGRAAASVLIDLGLPRLLSDNVDVRKLVLLVEIERDADRRRFRVDAKIKSRVTVAVGTAVTMANAESNWDFQIGSGATIPISARRLVEHVIATNGRPRIGVAITFQTHSGGRQTRDMRNIYPGLQIDLARIGMSLVLLADGQGMRTLSENVLNQLFKAVPHTMTLAQGESGGLKDAFLALAAPLPEPSVNSAGLSRLIQTTLQEKISIEASSLPVNQASARLALANYASANNHLSLRLSADGVALRWERSELVSIFRRIRWSFDGSQAIRGLIDLFGGSEDIHYSACGNLSTALVSLSDDPVFRSPFVLAATPAKVTTISLRELSRYALETSPESRVAVLITNERLTPQSLAELRGIQVFLPVTIVVVDAETCLAMAQLSESPRERLRALLLEQTDLTKLSPFVVRGVTPARVFFGREEEEAALLSNPANE
jgi:hypothetical protein